MKRRNFLKMFGIGVAAIIPLKIIAGIDKSSDIPDQTKWMFGEGGLMTKNGNYYSKEVLEKIKKSPPGGYKIEHCYGTEMKPTQLICAEEYRKDFEKLLRS